MALRAYFADADCFEVTLNRQAEGRGEKLRLRFQAFTYVIT